MTGDLHFSNRRTKNPVKETHTCAFTPVRPDLSPRNSQTASVPEHVALVSIEQYA